MRRETLEQRLTAKAKLKQSAIPLCHCTTQCIKMSDVHIPIHQEQGFDPLPLWSGTCCVLVAAALLRRYTTPAAPPHETCALDHQFHSGQHYYAQLSILLFEPPFRLSCENHSHPPVLPSPVPCAEQNASALRRPSCTAHTSVVEVARLMLSSERAGAGGLPPRHCPRAVIEEGTAKSCPGRGARHGTTTTTSMLTFILLVMSSLLLLLVLLVFRKRRR